jgi:hypothetical protein
LLLNSAFLTSEGEEEQQFKYQEEEALEFAK